MGYEMAVLKAALKNPYVQAVLRGLKPCIIGIILATGLYMVLHNCLGSVRNVQADAMADNSDCYPGCGLLYPGKNEEARPVACHAHRHFRCAWHAGIWILILPIITEKVSYDYGIDTALLFRAC